MTFVKVLPCYHLRFNITNTSLALHSFINQSHHPRKCVCVCVLSFILEFLSPPFIDLPTSPSSLPTKKRKRKKYYLSLNSYEVWLFFLSSFSFVLFYAVVCYFRIPSTPYLNPRRRLWSPFLDLDSLEESTFTVFGLRLTRLFPSIPKKIPHFGRSLIRVYYSYPEREESERTRGDPTCRSTKVPYGFYRSSLRSECKIVKSLRLSGWWRERLSGPNQLGSSYGWE